MPIQLGLSRPFHLPPRRAGRGGRRLRHLMLSSLALIAPHHLGCAPVRSHAVPAGDVRVSIDSFTALPPLRAYDTIIGEAAGRYGVDALLIRAVVQIESAFNPMAISRAGAQGLMQLMPAVARELGVTDPFDPRQNIMAGARYLQRLLERHDGNVRLALASYNAGPTNVARYGGVPPFRETRAYVAKVTRLVQQARRGVAGNLNRAAGA